VKLRVTLRFVVVTCALSIAACAAFRGNTRKEFGAYDIEDRQQYKHYLDNKAIRKRDADRKIVNSVKNPETGEFRQVKRGIGSSEAPTNALEPPPQENPKRDAKREYSWPARIIRRLFRLEN
jgi:hypothetical protein